MLEVRTIGQMPLSDSELAEILDQTRKIYAKSKDQILLPSDTETMEALKLCLEAEIVTQFRILNETLSGEKDRRIAKLETENERLAVIMQTPSQCALCNGDLTCCGATIEELELAKQNQCPKAQNGLIIATEKKKNDAR